MPLGISTNAETDGSVTLTSLELEKIKKIQIFWSGSQNQYIILQIVLLRVMEDTIFS